MDPVFDISIIISSYNREDKVLQTIERLFESDFSDFNKIELIIIDDGSPSPVAPLVLQLKAIPAKIDMRLITQKNTGIGGTRNRGYREAKAQIVIFLDDDILVHSDTIKKIYRTQLEGHGLVIFGSYPFISHSSESLHLFARHLFGYDRITTEEKFEKVDAITSGLLSVNKSKLKDKDNFYKDDLSIPAAEEHEIISRFHQQQIPIYYARHIAAIHNHHLELNWLVQQQYKYGLATAEAFIKNPEIAEMPRYDALQKNMDASSLSIKNLLKSLLASRTGRWLLLSGARIIEKIFPATPHNHLFGLLTSSYFRAGYVDGKRRFTKIMGDEGTITPKSFHLF